MKCPKCGGTGKEYWNGNVFCNTGFECYKCNGTGEVNQTNEEWFNNLPTEKKAEFMGDIWGRGYLTSHFEGNLEFGEKQDKAYWEMWLKQPHTTRS